MKNPILRAIKKRILISGIIMFFITLFLGVYITLKASDTARSGLLRESGLILDALVRQLEYEVNEIENNVKILSGSLVLIALLENENSENLNRANTAIDRYRKNLDVSVVYLMNKNGVVIASSNRDSHDSFAGKSHAFRPYFKQAAEGGLGRYYALGITRGERGVYASYPVKDKFGEIMGVAVIKKNMDDHEDAIRNYPTCMLVDNTGIVFISSSSRYALRSLWPLSKDVEKKIVENRQFGKGPFLSILNKKPDNNDVVLLKNRKMTVLMKPVGEGNWTMVLFVDATRISLFRIIGLGITVFACAVILASEKDIMKVRRNESYFRTIFQTAGSMIILGSSENIIIDVNNEAVQIGGWDKDEVVGRNCLDFISGKDKKAAEEMLSALFAGNDVKHMETSLITKDGSEKEISWNVVALKDLNEGIAGFIALGNDITEKNNFARQLTIEKERVEDFLYIMPSAVFIVDENKTIIKWNRMAEKITGYKSDEVLGKRCDVFMSDVCTGKCPLFAKDIQKPFFYNQWLIKRKDGNDVYIEKNVDVLKDENGKITGGIECFVDVTLKKMAEEKIRDAVETKSKFVSMVSHELRTPLTAIKEGVSLVLEELAGSINEEQRFVLNISKNSVDRLARLINGVLDYQKLGSGVMKLILTKKNINDLVNEVYSSMHFVAKEKGIDFKLILDEEMKEISCDADKVAQVLTNMINNAVKFTDSGTIITITTKMEKPIVHVMVEDEGDGIKEKDLPNVFIGFEQFSDDMKKRKEGTGLGLAISKEIIELHYGEIWVESEYGKGSIFHFSLPIK
ncbi:MAG: PAS domain S-box protein [Candidatus Theseobacter exili]|nr:PAS domain S-box protein [Candidatus Theseobacter exili]